MVNSKNKTFSYTFPTIFDPEGDKVALQITKGFLNETMTYYKNLQKIKFKPDKAGKHQLTINIMDTEGNFRNYQLKVEIGFDEEDLAKEAEQMAAMISSFESNKA